MTHRWARMGWKGYLALAALLMGCVGSPSKRGADAATEGKGGGGGGGDGGGAGGADGGGPKDGLPGIDALPSDCCGLAAAYNMYFAKALACSPGGGGECSEAVEPCLSKNPGFCKAFVNKDVAAELRRIVGAFTGANCFDPMGMPCADPGMTCAAAMKAYFGAASCVKPSDGGVCDPGMMKCKPI